MGGPHDGHWMDQCCDRSHMDRTARVAVWLRSAEGKQLQLFESILNGISQLVRERLQPFLGGAIVEAHRADAAKDRLQGVKAGRLVACHAARRGAKLAGDLFKVM